MPLPLDRCVVVVPNKSTPGTVDVANDIVVVAIVDVAITVLVATVVVATVEVGVGVITGIITGGA